MNKPPGTIVHEFTILREGWEMDNDGWIVRNDAGALEAWTTNHGGLYRYPLDELDENIAETAASLDGLKRARELLTGNSGGKDG